VNWSAVAVTAGVTVAVAGIGNLLIPKAALDWFRALSRPRWMVPYPVFIAAGITYYALMAVVLYRALDRHDTPAVTWSVVVLLANEAWNALFFGLRSTLAGFAGIVAFAVPLAALMVAAQDDRPSTLLLALYAVWVAYDIAWSFALWRRNPGR
jgi:benzodiazapine receptor